MRIECRNRARRVAGGASAQQLAVLTRPFLARR
jgi:hypothetical protein